MGETKENEKECIPQGLKRLRKKAEFWAKSVKTSRRG
jgi:hypothetical protein